jgi:hypothetical protein
MCDTSDESCGRVRVLRSRIEINAPNGLLQATLVSFLSSKVPIGINTRGGALAFEYKIQAH